MVNIYGWAADFNGQGYWRIGLPFGQLREQYGLDAQAVAELPFPLYPAPSIVVGQRVHTPAVSLMWEGLKIMGHKLVFEIDDDFWNIHPSNEGPHRYYQGEVLDRLNANIAAADLVTVSTETLARLVRPINERVVVLPNYIDGAVLDHERTRNQRLTIGWAGGSSHLHDINIVTPALRTVLGQRPDVDMHFVGHDFTATTGARARHTGWKSDVISFQLSLDFDIGLAPLADFKFNWSKSPIKALEYGALGIPTIASPVGPYREFVIHGETGFLARTQGDWVRYLRELINDDAMREEMGRNAKRLAAQNTIQGHVDEWAIAYGELLG